MATYFHGGAPDIQPVDGLQTLYLMNPSYVAYADSSSPTSHHHHHHHPNNNMVFLNSPLTSLTPPVSQHQQPPPQQHFVGIPLHNLQDSSTSLQGYNNLWGTAAPNMINSIDFQMKRAAAAAATSSPAQQQQGLSLSLSQEVAAGGGGDQEVKTVGMMGSKYLKAAQELLDEVVSVGNSKGIDNGGIMEKRVKESNKMAGKEEEEGGGDGGGGGGDLSTAERQELQMKKAKLVNMLDEVEQRYRQYHHQMQMVVSSFEAVAGYGSAKSYTALALQTISKQFRCLRDTISDQVRATSKSLGGEEDCLPLAGAGGSKSSVGSRLRFVDHHIRQQRALQQLGMMQHNAWRPQRGLPERAVSVLRAWLFEHFLHPYPKDSDKHMLAKQTGLTRSQVSNWFINARVRLWKPMVEEMYLEETKEREQSNDNNTTTTKISKSETSDHSLSPSKSPSHQPTTSSPSVADHPKHSPQLSSALHSSSDFNMMFTDESLIQQRMKKPRTTTTTTTNENQMPDELSNRELLMKFMDQGGAFGGYPMSEIARFDHHEQFPPPRFGANGVSLTLGLPHCEYLSTESIQMGRSIEMNTAENNNYFNLNNTNGNNLNNPSSSHTPSGYESINIQNRKRFSAQLLPDYVA